MALPNDKIAQMARDLKMELRREGFTVEESVEIVAASMRDIIDEAKYGRFE